MLAAFTNYPYDNVNDIGKTLQSRLKWMKEKKNVSCVLGGFSQERVNIYVVITILQTLSANAKKKEYILHGNFMQIYPFCY